MSEEFKPYRFCPKKQEKCYTCTTSCRIQDLIDWVNGINEGNDNFGFEEGTLPAMLSDISEEEITSFYNKVNSREPKNDGGEDEYLLPFKDRFEDLF